jgi:hypothetical protein
VFSIWDRLAGTYEPEWIFGQTQYVGVSAKELEGPSSTQVVASSETKLTTPLLSCEESAKVDEASEEKVNQAEKGGEGFVDPVPTKKIFYERSITWHNADDYEPLRYGVIPQFHHWDMAWANFYPWHYILFIQSKWHGLSAPFRHWTPPGSKCPPMSESSKINSLKQSSATALHLGWSMYALVQFLLFAFAAGAYIGSNGIASRNLQDTIFSAESLACDKPNHVMPLTCEHILGPLTALLKMDNIVSSIVQICVFAFGLWTMSNIGSVLMGTEQVRKDRFKRRKLEIKEALLLGTSTKELIQEKFDQENQLEALLAEESSCQIRLFVLESFRHILVLCLSLWIGDALIFARPSRHSRISWEMLHFIVSYAAIQATLFVVVYAVGCSGPGARSTLRRRQMV